MTQHLWTLCTELYFPRNLKLRSPDTRRQYRLAIDHYGEHLGHAATTADLDDDLLTVWMSSLLDRGLSPMTVRERAGRITALWRWLAKRRIVDHFPTLTMPDVPEPQPVAMREDDLRRLFQSAAKERGSISGIPADLWWTSLLAFVWSTAERKGAALAVRREWVDLEHGTCSIPASVRKGKRKPAIYHLWPQVVDLIRRTLAYNPHREHIWPWEKHPTSYWNHLRRIATDAGWPDDRKHKTHSLRVSHATWRTAMGGDAAKALKHSDPETTRRHYIDQRFLPQDESQLFVPWEG